MSKTKMFEAVSSTWNPWHGCNYNCLYCWARELATTRLKESPRYRNGFAPELVESELSRKFKKGEIVFTVDMGDLWGDWVYPEPIFKVLEAVRRNPGTTFLCLTKNPQRYHDFLNLLPENVILGATLESNRDYPTLTQAPTPYWRYWGMAHLPARFRRMVSIEPLLKFDLPVFLPWLERIAPEVVYVGYDNHNHHLPDPPQAETERLISALERFTTVKRKTMREA